MDVTEIIKNMLGTLSDAAIAIVGKLLFAIILYVVGRQVVKLIKRLFTKSRAASGMSESARGFISSCINVVLNLILVLTVVSVLGVPMTSIVALLGSAGLAVGLALQGGLSNFAGGIMILIFKPFEVGDYIVANGVEGSVTAISVFYTTLITVDNKRVVVPNSIVSNETITNVSAEDDRRLDIPVSVPADTDIERVKALLTEIAGEDGRVTAHEPPASLLVGYSSGAYDFELRVWCHKNDYWPLRFALLERIPERFAREGIALARTALDVRTK